MLDTVSLSSTPRSTLTRHRERGRTDRADLYAVLDAGLICHLTLVRDGAPVALPTGYGRIDDTVYLHGSTGAGYLRAIDGAPICLTVTHLDGIVYARSVFQHSMNFTARWCMASLATSPTLTRNGLRWKQSSNSSPPGRGPTPDNQTGANLPRPPSSP